MKSTSELDNITIKSLEQIKDDILTYIKYCYDDKFSSKAIEIKNLWIECKPYIVGSDLHDKFANKLAEFEEEIRRYEKKWDSDWFNKAFNKYFSKPLKKWHHRQKIHSMKRLAWFILNRNINQHFSDYKKFLYEKELYNTLSSAKQQESQDNTENQYIQENENIDNNAENYIWPDQERFEIAVSDLENKVAWVLSDVKWEPEEIRHYLIEDAIDKFRKEQKDLYSEEELDLIVWIFYDKNKNL